MTGFAPAAPRKKKNWGEGKRGEASREKIKKRKRQGVNDGLQN